MKILVRCLIAIVLVMGIVSLGLWIKGEKAATPDPSTPAGEPVAAAARRDIESSLLLTGEVSPAFQNDVKPEVGGKIKSINVRVGQNVKKGDLLAVIDDRDLLTEMDGAQTQIDGAKLEEEKTRGNYERAKALYEQKLVSKEVYVNLQADLAIAENTLEKAQRAQQSVKDRLAKTHILAPADGSPLDISVNEGQVVSAAASVTSGTVIMTFANLSHLIIKSSVNQVDAPRLQVGQQVEIIMGEGQQNPIHGHVDVIAQMAMVKNNVKGFLVQVVIDDNDGRLKPGMSVSMNVPVGKVANAVSVPVSAVFRDQKENIVYVRKGDQTERRPVTVGIMDLSFAEIKSGLKEGEEVLLVEPPPVLPTKS